jgi:hypothetical protein
MDRLEGKVAAITGARAASAPAPFVASSKRAPRC